MSANRMHESPAANERGHRNVRPLDRDLLLIAGAQRSGTRFMTQLAHDAFDFGVLAPEQLPEGMTAAKARELRRRPGSGEAKFLLAYYRKAAQWAPFDDDAALRNFVVDLLKSSAFSRRRRLMERRYPHKSLDFSVDEILTELHERTYPEIAHTVFSRLAYKLGKTRIGCGFPAALLRLDLINAMFPRCKVVHCVRDGRDVMLSTFKTQFGARTVYHGARQWSDYVATGRRWGDDLLGPARYLEVRYEDRLERPRESLDRIASFLAVDPAPSALAAYVERVENSPRRTNYNKWKTRLSPRQVRVFDTLAGDSLRMLGYEVGEARARIGPLARVGYAVANVSLKLGPSLKRLLLRPKDAIGGMTSRRVGSRASVLEE